MKKITACVFALLLGACAGTTPQSDPAYVPANMYDSYNCNQIRMEGQRLARKVSEVSEEGSSNQVLGAAAAMFALSQGYSVDGNNTKKTSEKTETDLRRLKNQEDVLEQTFIAKNCH